MPPDQTDPVRILVDKGVTLPAPHTVELDPALDPNRIHPSATIHAGCRLRGEQTTLSAGCVLGEEQPVTLDNCQLGENAQLKGGFFSHATLLANASMASGAHVRPGTLLEEQATCGHTVALKQTLLMPFVTLGSLINFCDCLMAGGTSRRDHSEVGSSYIHFNYTPHQDKATPSRLGDVPGGVMLDQEAIFLGGQGGLVGPCHLAYGTTTAAGVICRRDVTQPGMLVLGSDHHEHRVIPYDRSRRHDVDRTVNHNLAYIGSLLALREWYRHVREPFMTSDPFALACHQGALDRLREMIGERIKRMSHFIASLPVSPSNENWPAIAARLEAEKTCDGDTAHRDTFLAAVEKKRQNDYLQTIQSLDPTDKQTGTEWLQSIVNTTLSLLAP